ncbi:hypothetical protein Tco_0903636 [Tanacetum coccineum]
MFSIIYEPVHGIIYKNSKKEKQVIRHSEIRKFCDAMLNRVLEGLKSYNNDVKKIEASKADEKMGDNLNELKEELIEEVQEMLNIFESMEQKVTKKSLKEQILQNEIYRLLEVSLTSEIQNCELISVGKQKNKSLQAKLVKSSNDSKDIQANLLKRIKILENDFKRSQAQSIDFELKLQHQKEKMACDVSWKSKVSTINDENVLLKIQVDSVNQDLLIKIYELKNKLKTVDKGKNVNTKFDKFETSGTLLFITPLPKNIAVKVKKVSNSKVNTHRSKPVTSHSTPKNKQSRIQNVNFLTRGMYRLTTIETQTPDSKTNIHVSNSTGVESSNSVRRPKSKDIKLKNKVLKNTNDKSSTAHVWKMSSSVSIDSNKLETMHSNVCQSNTSVLSTKTVNVVNDGSNIVCVSCGKDVFLLSHEKCVASYALSRNSSVKRALFTTPITSKSKSLGATFVVAKSRLSISKTPTATNKNRIRVRSTSNTLVTTQKWVAKLSTLLSAFVSCDAGDPAHPLDCAMLVSLMNRIHVRSKLNSVQTSRCVGNMFLLTWKASHEFQDSGFELIAYSDADLAGCLDDYKSTYGGL